MSPDHRKKGCLMTLLNSFDLWQEKYKPSEYASEAVERP